MASFWIRLLMRIIIPVCLIIGIVWFARPQSGHLRIIFFDTPGDSILIQTPGGKYVLIDGGSDPSVLALALGRTLPFWQRTLDVVVLTRGDDARLPGQIAALSRYHARQVLAPARWKTGKSTWGILTETGFHLAPDSQGPAPLLPFVQEWVRLTANQQRYVARPGYRLALDETFLTVLATEGEEASGLLLQLDYGITRIVFALECDALNNERLLAIAQPLTALAYPWQCTMDTPLLNVWQPQALIFTTGQRFDKPALLTYAERARYSPHIYHQDHDGTIELVCTNRPRRGVNGATMQPCTIQTEK